MPGLGDLDECNGHFANTPDFPDGMSVYHTTRHNGAGGLGFPYLPLCYKCVVETSNIRTGGGGMGPWPPP